MARWTAHLGGPIKKCSPNCNSGRGLSPFCRIVLPAEPRNPSTPLPPMKTIVIVGVAAFLLAAASTQAADVKENWEKQCLKCHGPDGKGQTRMGRQAGVKDYTDPKVQAELKDENAIKAIKEGIVDKGKKKMEPYKDKLSDDEIKALIEHMRAFGKK